MAVVTYFCREPPADTTAVVCVAVQIFLFFFCHFSFLPQSCVVDLWSGRVNIVLWAGVNAAFRRSSGGWEAFEWPLWRRVLPGFVTPPAGCNVNKEADVFLLSFGFLESLSIFNSRFYQENDKPPRPQTTTSAGQRFTLFCQVMCAGSWVLYYYNYFCIQPLISPELPIRRIMWLLDHNFVLKVVCLLLSSPHLYSAPPLQLLGKFIYKHFFSFPPFPLF